VHNVNDILIEKEISNMNKSQIAFKVFYEKGETNEPNCFKIPNITIGLASSLFKYTFFWFLTVKECFSYLMKGCHLGFLKDFLAGTKNIIKRTEFLKQQDKNSIFYSYFFNDVAVSLALLKKYDSAYQVVSRTHGFETYKEQAPFHYIPFQKFKLKYIDYILPVSKQGKNYLINQFPNYSHKIKAMYLGTQSHTHINPFNTSISIVSCAYVRSIKRLDLIPNALRLIDFPVSWTIIGDGEDLPKIKALCKELPKHISVKFLGNKSEKEIQDIYKTIPYSFLLSTSSSEGLPISMMEAISFGIPIISTDVGGCNEIATEETGILISKDFSSDNLKDAILEFKNSHFNQSEVRVNIKNFWMLNFNCDTNFNQFLKTINQ
jgi:colanic acid/amylovoran biosynthesis glycosyltransferase